MEWEWKLDGKNYNLGMELGWNGMEYSVESSGSRNGNGMERNEIFRWNSNGMEWKWNGMEME